VPCPLRSANGWRRATLSSGSRHRGPTLSGSGVAMPTQASPFRVGNTGRRGECALVRVRPQPRLLLTGRRTECRVRHPRVRSDSRARCRVLGCRLQDIVCGSGGAGKTKSADAVWVLEGAASLPGDGKRSARWGSTSAPRSGAWVPAIISSLGWASKRKPKPKNTTTVATATTPREIR
jgi:hypothetical protein